jgi:hypothetical protein
MYNNVPCVGHPHPRVARAVAAAGGVRGVGAGLLAWLGTGGDNGGPAAAPLAWAAVAYTRREIGQTSTAAKAAAATSSGEPAVPGAVQPAIASAAVVSPSASAVGGWQPGQFLQQFMSLLVSDGTEAHPNAGLLLGNGFSWTAQTCTGGASCTGGNSGLIGNGGNGYNGGNGGAAAWFGNGGAGGDAVTVLNGGVGGAGGLLTGNGGHGGNGGIGVSGTSGTTGTDGSDGYPGSPAPDDATYVDWLAPL